MAQILAKRELNSGHIAWVVMSEVADGDMSIGNYQTREKSIQQVSYSLERLNPGLQVPPISNWSYLTQVHGIQILEVTGDDIVQGEDGDALVTTLENSVLTVRVADCVPISLISEGGAIAIIHAGWRGLLKGVLEETSNKLMATKPGKQMAVIGSHIGPCCYEFGREELDQFIQKFGISVEASTKINSSSLNLSAVVERICDEKGIEIIRKDSSCTSCLADTKYWSFRFNSTELRQCLFAWIEKK
ncbi:MAG: hypothetical protein CL512_04675 [Actinobacteria bacterium]|nr:hypothetical protein [Actinomycetota bacterium]